MIRLIDPRPDEFAFGYEGRLAILNGFQRRAELHRALAGQFVPQYTTQPTLARMHLLACAAGSSLTHFLASHTMLPVERAIASGSAGPYAWSGARVDRLLFPFGISPLSSRDCASLCPRCVSQDLQTQGFSYWRRVHQLCGQYLCPHHPGTPLLFASFDDFSRPPSVAMEHARPEDQTVLDLCARTPQVARFLGISAGLLRVEAPANANSIAASIRERLSSLGFPESQRVARKQLSDHVAKSLPHAWSDRALPTLARHRPGTADDVLDSIFSEQAWSKTAAPYIAVAAAIWDDESEALAAFMIPRRNHSDLGHPELAAAAA